MVTCTGAFASDPNNATATHPPTHTLNVNNLTANITPDAGHPGVSLTGIRPKGSNGSKGNLSGGGNGSSGSAGADLWVNYSGGGFVISTEGEKAHGIVIISKGGNGGNGGDSDSIKASGGRGGHAGAGGSVNVDASGRITTSGASAHGILAQSIGGNGGNGGDGAGVDAEGGDGGNAAGGGTVTVNSASRITTWGTSAHGIFGQSIGGNGGKGGGADGISADSGAGSPAAPGGLVDIDNSGIITTNGAFSFGILAQSIGGFGGKGGNGGGLVAYGGSGASAGPGGAVDVSNTGTIITLQEGSHAIFAQSIGGGGGAGGSAGGLAALGASGSVGGSGGSVTVENIGLGHISTSGDGAAGIYAQSLGGGGGDGGSSGGLVSIGGKGSGTSDGGTVTVTNSQTITTQGDRSQAIFAQSIGGGGGNGGTSAGLIAIGGSGGGGGDGSTVEVSNSGTLTTSGVDSAGIFAQSVGGGGGNGGNSFSAGYVGSLAIGGEGAKGGVGGTVIINETADANQLALGTISTFGDRSHGIQAQSIGGGGGNGGLAISAADGASVSAAVALGGQGGGGGAAGAVTVNEKGTITTAGEQSHGIFAQSIGGGGGNGGGSVSVATSGGYSLGFAMGGSAGDGGNAGAVTVNAIGDITTAADLSHAVFAQSVGGGGGSGGFGLAATAGPISGSVALGGTGGGGGDGSTVVVNTSGAGFAHPTIRTSGDGSVGILAQSVGGGGGNGGFAGTLGIGGGAVSVGLGGDGESGGSGGAVEVSNGNAISTAGSGATGILAQSIGGGGGNGGFAVSGSGGVISVAAAIGGSGDVGGNGGMVTVDNSGDISTLGALAYGIQAQSIGGGGGNGGFAISGALGVSVEKIPGGAAAISVGGTGAGASAGGFVGVDNSGSIETVGLGSHAIFAQSVGGGGGNGGFAGSLAMTLGTGAAFGVSVGGFGGDGGDGGEVEVESTGASITTHADGSDGIHAQSIGGGGGDGGFAFSGAFGFGGTTNVNLSVAIGGFGADGGIGRAVVVDNETAITTSGSHSNGIFAQSIGGGGGNGGFAASGTIGFSDTPVQIGVTVGGFGGNGATADAVTILNSGAIVTKGDESVGILGQSIGGSGGNGGLALSASFNAASKNSGALNVAIGGGGGDGNSAGVVTIDNLQGGAIHTEGFGSHGIKGQSIGGGGGNGGLAVAGGVGLSGEKTALALNVAVGGAAGDGGFGGTVHITNGAGIEVEGDTATGIFAQSVGGGGGDGGGALTAIGQITNTVNEDARTVAAQVAVGGAGGDGNYGGQVIVDNTGNITTRGVSGYGVFAQSVGGGGGIGGRANALALVVGQKCAPPIECPAQDNKSNNISLRATIGGDGGGASDGGNVTVDNSGVIETFEDSSDGIFAQSVGGGGGAGGNGILGSGEILPVPVDVLLTPVSRVSFFKNLTIAVGGSAGASGKGGVVHVKNSKDITTHGPNSNGIFAQSVGGGGGVGGKGVIGATGKIGLGGEGGAAGDGGEVIVSQTGGATIETFGVASNGIFAQSVGGGGGVAGNVDRALTAGTAEAPLPGLPGLTVPVQNIGVGLAFGGNGGHGGDGGNVNVDVDGRIITHGDNSAGIFAQSVGGGGGMLGELGNDFPVLELLSWQVGSAGDAGKAGEVEVSLKGAIQTAGNNATGIFAQSAGGQGIGGPVNIVVDGSVLTGSVLSAGDESRGLGSVGILAQSVASDDAKNGDVSITIASTSGIVQGGRSQVVDANRAFIGVGLWVIDGNNNTITNNGLVTTLGGVDDGFAILATGSDGTHTGGNESISNFGTVTGSFDLGAGTNSFTNETGSLLNAGRFAFVGDGNLFLNSGRMSPGGDERVMTTEVLGNWEQSTTGTYAVDLDLWWTDDTGSPSKEADQVFVTGAGSGTADLAGTVDLTPLSRGNALPGDHEVLIVRAINGVTIDTQTNLGLITPPSAVASYELLYPNATDIVLGYHIDFAPDGLNPNEDEFGEQINNIQLAFPRPTNDPDAEKDTPLAPLVKALFELPDLPALKNAYNLLGPAIYVENQLSTLLSTLDFQNALHCRDRDGAFRFVREDDCFSVRVSQTKLDRERTSRNIGFQELATGFSIGAQSALNGNLAAGFGLSYEQTDLDTDNDAWSEGERFHGGLVLKGSFGSTSVSAALTAGYAQYDTDRLIVFPGISEQTHGNHKFGFGALHLRAAHSFDNGPWYFRPAVDFGVTRQFLRDFRETGSDLVGLAFESDTQTFLTVQPSAELGAEFQSDSILYRPFIRLGVTHFIGDDAPSIDARLQHAPAGVPPFTTTDDFSKTFAEIAAGLDITMPNGSALRFDGSWLKSDELESISGSAKLSIKF